jgi:hypothetical protein
MKEINKIGCLINVYPLARIAESVLKIVRKYASTLMFRFDYESPYWSYRPICIAYIPYKGSVQR